MSWKSAGKLVSGPPSAHPSHGASSSGWKERKAREDKAAPAKDSEAGPSSSLRLDQRFRPNLGGTTAWQREREMASRYGDYATETQEKRKSEWDVLRENHRFIRDDEEPEAVSWEERLARAYESKLFKEFALIDLKHYKTRRLALRWRTAPEVVEGIGEDTCASLRCKYHQPVPPYRSPSPDGVRFGFSDRNDDYDDEDDHHRRSDLHRRDSRKRRRTKPPPLLRAFELPFAYEEAGARKEALVKVKLCPRCQAKLTWKPGKADASSDEDEDRDDRRRDIDDARDGREHRAKRRHRDRERDEDQYRRSRADPDGGADERHRRRSGRDGRSSASPVSKDRRI